MSEWLSVVVGPTVRVDRGTVEGLVHDACEALDVPADVHWCDEAQLGDRLASATGMTVVVPGTDVELVGLLGVPGDAGLVRFDLHDRERDPSVSQHLRGIGLGGIGWAVRAAVHAVRRPATRVAYGTHEEQFGHLRMPAPDGRPAPVVVLVHGGYWRSRWQLDLMDAIAIDLTERGYASWNLEYRRPDRHGWDATVADLRAGVRHVDRLAPHLAGSDDGPGLDTSEVVVIGHSAGGQLALQVAEDLADEGAAPSAVVSLAGVVDLDEAHARGMGAGAVAMALGGDPSQRADRYLAASPIARPVRRVPTLVVQGAQDDPDLVEMNRRFAARLRSSDAPHTWIERPGDHFAVIDPSTEMWQAVVQDLSRSLD